MDNTEEFDWDSFDWSQPSPTKEPAMTQEPTPDHIQELEQAHKLGVFMGMSVAAARGLVADANEFFVNGNQELLPQMLSIAAHIADGFAEMLRHYDSEGGAEYHEAEQVKAEKKAKKRNKKK